MSSTPITRSPSSVRHQAPRPLPYSVPAETSPGASMQTGARGNATDTYTKGTKDHSRHARTTGPRGVAPVRPSLLSPTAVKNAVVVGAGPCGLLAALELVQNGASVTLIEQRQAYTRPIHWNVRADLLHRIAETCPGALEKVMAKLGPIESVENIDATRTNVTPEQLEKLQKDRPNRKFIAGPDGLKWQQKGARNDQAADAQLARFGGMQMLTSPSIGQILTFDLENILFAELKRLAQLPENSNTPRITILRGHRCELSPSPDKPGWSACTAYEIAERADASGKKSLEPTGKRVPLGTPDLVINSDGASSAMREAAGIAHTHVSPATRYISASIAIPQISADAPNGGLARRRYAELVNPADGSVHGVRQVVLGITTAPRSWVLVEAPPFVDLTTKEAADAFFYEHAARLLGMSQDELRKAPITWGPNPFTMQQYISATAVKGENVVFAGDAVGNAHFLTSGGVMTATVPHIRALEKLLANLADGVPRWLALDCYNRWTMAGTKAWLKLGHNEFGRLGDKHEPFESALAAALERLAKAETKPAA